MGCGVARADWFPVFGTGPFILRNVPVDGPDCGGCEEIFGRIGGAADARKVIRLQMPNDSLAHLAFKQGLWAHSGIAWGIIKWLRAFLIPMDGY